MYDDDDKPKKSNVRKSGEFGPKDLFLGLFGLLAMLALAIAGFKIAKWVVQTYWP